MQTNNTTPVSTDTAPAAAADFNSATGPVAIRMNNDYLFQSVYLAQK